jgi:hypothetical protein
VCLRNFLASDKLVPRALNDQIATPSIERVKSPPQPLNGWCAGASRHKHPSMYAAAAKRICSETIREPYWKMATYVVGVGVVIVVVVLVVVSKYGGGNTMLLVLEVRLLEVVVLK